MTRLFAVLAILSSVSVAQAAQLASDPATGRKFFFWDSEGARPRVELAWTFQQGTAEKIDFEKIAAADEAYITSIADSLENTVNLLVDTKTNHVIKDLDSEKSDFRACYSTGVFSSNHCDIEAKYDEKSKLVAVVLDAKWGTAHVSLHRLKEKAGVLEAQASAISIEPILANDTLLALELKYGSKSAFVKNRDRLAHGYKIDAIRLVSEDKTGYAIDLDVVASGEIPKGDGFSYEGLKLGYRVRARQSYDTLVLQKRK